MRMSVESLATTYGAATHRETETERGSGSGGTADQGIHGHMDDE